ncbi:MAG: fibronectin type III domain-containing protein [Nitrosopumilus sp.]|nr:fibronectin type III domain-containing protein [Nitrosopumilus sp.]NRA05812.1 fibronectin type III domain-containing protein [Nitrosopumilus sp.]
MLKKKIVTNCCSILLLFAVFFVAYGGLNHVYATSPIITDSIIGDSQVMLTWSAPTDVTGIINHVIEVDSGSGFVTYSHVSNTATSAVISNLENGQSYSFRVSAVTTTGTGITSPEVSVTPIGKPANVDLPTFDSSKIDLGTGIFDITFSKIIQNTNSGDVDLTKLFISNTNQTNQIPLSGNGQIATLSNIGTNSVTLSFTITESQRQQIIAFGSSAVLQLDIVSNAVKDTSNNPIVATSDNIISRIVYEIEPIIFSAGGSSSESTPPSLTTSFDEGTETLSINGIGIAPEQFKTSYTMDSPITVTAGNSIPFSVKLYDNISWSYISHMELCLNMQTSNNRICDSDTKIIWDKNNNDNNTLEIIDPNGLIDTATLNIREIDSHVASFDYSVTFAGAMDTSDIQIYTWDNRRNALSFTVENALEIVLRSSTSSSSTSSSSTSSSSTSSSSTSSSSTSSSSTSSSSNILSKSTAEIILMWAGFSAEHATNSELLQSLGIKTTSDYVNLPQWTKTYLGEWVAKNKITSEQLKISLSYLMDIEK